MKEIQLTKKYLETLERITKEKGALAAVEHEIKSDILVDVPYWTLKTIRGFCNLWQSPRPAPVCAGGTYNPRAVDHYEEASDAFWNRVRRIENEKFKKRAEKLLDVEY